MRPGPASIDPGVREGLKVSILSLGWTIAAGSAAISIGVIGDNLTLTVFGLIGLLDAAGSWSLVMSFRHAQRHDAISPRRERVALMVVGTGMAAVGAATIGDSVYRLERHVKSNPLVAGVVVAGLSIAVLGGLSVWKRRIARRIGSGALNADGWLSATGALLACVALAGTALDSAFGWWWIDPVAAVLVACGAVGLGAGAVRKGRERTA